MINSKLRSYKARHAVDAVTAKKNPSVCKIIAYAQTMSVYYCRAVIGQR